MNISVKNLFLIDIHWSDLTREAQEQIANRLGYETPEACAKYNNWDMNTIPIATIEFEIEGSEDDE